LRATWASSAAAVIALAAARPVDAHITVSPGRATPGSEATLTFTVPNETFDPRRPTRIDAVTVVPPRGVRVGQAEAKPGWTMRVSGRGVSWSGGSILYGQYATFGLVVELPDRTASVSFRGEEHFAFPRRRVERFPVPLELHASTAAAGDTSGVAEAALVIAVAAAAVLAGAGVFLGLRRWVLGGEG
jgi:uncharacterized protein YcnI